MTLFSSDDDARWLQVQSRSATSDGAFVYGVRTTRIYCRPICKARLARRANVSFFDTPVEARAAGFRACKRCHPDLVGGMPEDQAVRKIRALLSRGPDVVSGEGDGGLTPLSLGQMARQTGLSKWHFHRVFKKCAGVTPVEYLRLQRAASSSPTQKVVESVQTVEFAVTDYALDFTTEFPDLRLALSPDTATDTASSTDSPVSFDDFLIWPEDDFEFP